MSSPFAPRQPGGFRPTPAPEVLQVRVLEVKPFDMLDSGQFVRSISVLHDPRGPLVVHLDVGVLHMRTAPEGYREPAWNDLKQLTAAPTAIITVTRGLARYSRPAGEAAAEARDRHARIVEQLRRLP